jgi:hypothetical protein
MDSSPYPIARLEQHAARIGALVSIESTEGGYRLLIDATADLVLDEMLVGYMEEELGLALEDDLLSAPPGWRRLGIIVGAREVTD